MVKAETDIVTHWIDIINLPPERAANCKPKRFSSFLTIDLNFPF